MKLLAIDGNSVFNRAFYGIKLLSTKNGVFTNAIFGFLNILFRVSDEVKPDAVAIAFDLKAPTFRHKMYDGYKANRKGMPDELAMQMPYLKDILKALGYHLVEKEGFEGDDILGTLARACKETKNECVIATGDRDSLQLIGDGVSVRLTSTQHGSAVSVLYDSEAVHEKYRVYPKSIIDLKALMGDSSDNVPGVAGIGEKTATDLIERYETIENLYENFEKDDKITPAVKKKLDAGRQMARLSKELVTIVCDVPIETDLDSYRPAPIDRAKAYSLFFELEMPSMIQKLNLWDASESLIPKTEEKAVEVDTFLIKDPQKSAISFTADTVFVSFENGAVSVFDGEKAYYTDELTFEFLKALFENYKGKIVTNDCKSLYYYLISNSLPLTEVEFDLSLAAYLLNPQSNDYSIGKLALEYNAPCPNSQQMIVEKCVENVKNSLTMPFLYKKMDKEIVENDMKMLICDVEIPLSKTLSDMEVRGFKVDTVSLKNYGDEITARIDSVTQEIYEMAGEQFNLNSPRQLAVILFEKLELPGGKKTKNGYSTNADILEKLRPKHPIIDKILEYRKLSKLKSTYVDALLSLVGDDGRIHTTFNQTETRTGRISSKEPNLQNIPVRTALGSRLREFFVAEENCVLVDADYSQIELRVLAALSNDKNMTQAFNSGLDIHTATAAQVFNMPEILVTPQMRSQAKAVNFGIVYGIGAFSLSNDIGVSVKEADNYIKNYLLTYSGVDRFLKQIVKDGEEKGYVKTYFNRRRYMPELKASNRMVKAAGERIAKNAPIQGTAADIIKIAMVRVYNRLLKENLKARLILQVHDELIVECPESESLKVREILNEEMSNAVTLSVPLTVDANIGENWLEAKG